MNLVLSNHLDFRLGYNPYKMLKLKLLILTYFFLVVLLQPYVVMKDLQTGVEYLWPKAKFINRKYVMDEMYENYEDGDDWQLEDEKDPFTESRDVESLIGCVAVPMQSLGYVVRMRMF